MTNFPSTGFHLEHNPTTRECSNVWSWLYKKKTSGRNDLVKEKGKHDDDLQTLTSNTGYGEGTKHGQQASSLHARYGGTVFSVPAYSHQPMHMQNICWNSPCMLENTGKFMELNEEKLEMEEKEFPVSTFTSPEGQACELITKAGNREINNDISTNKKYLLETTINESQSQNDSQLDKNS